VLAPQEKRVFLRAPHLGGAPKSYPVFMKRKQCLYGGKKVLGKTHHGGDINPAQ